MMIILDHYMVIGVSPKMVNSVVDIILENLQMLAKNIWLAIAHQP